jgi:hypothetical protein
MPAHVSGLQNGCRTTCSRCCEGVLKARFLCISLMDRTGLEPVASAKPGACQAATEQHHVQHLQRARRREAAGGLAVVSVDQKRQKCGGGGAKRSFAMTSPSGASCATYAKTPKRWRVLKTLHTGQRTRPMRGGAPSGREMLLTHGSSPAPVPALTCARNSRCPTHTPGGGRSPQCCRSKRRSSPAGTGSRREPDP